jgi:hypothetical protein
MMLACGGAGEPEPPAVPTCCEEPSDPGGRPRTYYSNRDEATCLQVGGKMVSKAECAPTCCKVSVGDGEGFEMMPAVSCQYFCCGEGREPVDASFCP